MSSGDTAARLLACGTSALSDALDKMGIEGQIPGVLPIERSMRFAGTAFTVEMLPAGQSGGSVGDYIDDVEPGQVVVIANDGRLDATVWGDILTSVAAIRGIAGTVIMAFAVTAIAVSNLAIQSFPQAGGCAPGRTV